MKIAILCQTSGTNCPREEQLVSYGSSQSGLHIQIDAAINHGNSGGPAIADDKMIGLVFRSWPPPVRGDG